MNADVVLDSTPRAFLPGNGVALDTLRAASPPPGEPPRFGAAASAHCSDGITAPPDHRADFEAGGLLELRLADHGR